MARAAATLHGVELGPAHGDQGGRVHLAGVARSIAPGPGKGRHTSLLACRAEDAGPEHRLHEAEAEVHLGSVCQPEEALLCQQGFQVPHPGVGRQEAPTQLVGSVSLAMAPHLPA